MLLVPPGADGVDDAGNKLAHRALAPRAAERPAAKIFGHHHVGRGLRPFAGYFDVVLFEHHPTVFAGDQGGAQLPLNLGQRIDTGAGEEALDGDAATIEGAVRLTDFWF